MEDSSGDSQHPKILSPHDLIIDPGSPSAAEHWVSVISKLLLVGSAGGMLVATFAGMIVRGWPLGGAITAAVPFCLPFMMVGFLLLQVATSMRQKRDDDSRKIAWEEYLAEQAEAQKQLADEEVGTEASIRGATDDGPDETPPRESQSSD